MANDEIPRKPKEQWLIELVRGWESRHEILEWLRVISSEAAPYLKVPEPSIFVGVRVHRDIFGVFNFIYDWREKRILVHREGMDKLLRRIWRGAAPYDTLVREVTSFLEGFFVHYEYYIEHIKKGDEIVAVWLAETDIPYHERASTNRAFKFADEMADRYVKFAWKYPKWYSKRVKRKIII